MSKKDMGIDLGTANTLIFVKSKGILLNEPSVVAITSDSDKPLTVGFDAKNMMERTPDKIKAIYPMNHGAISEFKLTGIMLEHFIGKISGKRLFKNSRALISVPAGLTSVEKHAVGEIATLCGIKKSYLVEEPMAAAIGAGLDVYSPSGCMILDIGGGTSEVAVISLGEIVCYKSIRCAGDAFDEAIKNYIRKKYNVLLGIQGVEKIKIAIGTVLKGDPSVCCHAGGRSCSNFTPCTVCVTSDDVKTAIIPEVYKIIRCIKSVLEEISPQLCSDILKSGIVLTGGGALINGIDRLICDAVGMPVKIADSPLECVVSGLGILLENKSKKLFKSKT